MRNLIPASVIERTKKKVVVCHNEKFGTFFKTFDEVYESLKRIEDVETIPEEYNIDKLYAINLGIVAEDLAIFSMLNNMSDVEVATVNAKYSIANVMTDCIEALNATGIH